MPVVTTVIETHHYVLPPRTVKGHPLTGYPKNRKFQQLHAEGSAVATVQREKNAKRNLQPTCFNNTKVSAHFLVCSYVDLLLSCNATRFSWCVCEKKIHR